VEVRRLWPDVVEATKLRRRVAWMHLTQNSQVIAVEGNVLTLGFTNAGARDSFLGGGCDEILRQAAIDVAGVDWKVEAIVDPGTTGGTPAASAPAATPPPAAGSASESGSGSASGSAGAADGPPAWAQPESSASPPSPPAPPARQPADPESGAAHDDLDAEADDLAGAALLERELGAQVIEEIRHS
jgi:DNA polymerase-3 subunit gamma/tau